MQNYIYHYLYIQLLNYLMKIKNLHIYQKITQISLKKLELLKV